MHTDIHGDFKLVLPEGGYDVFVTSPGFAAGSRDGSCLVQKNKKGTVEAKTFGLQFPRHELRYLPMINISIAHFLYAEDCTAVWWSIEK